MEKQRCVESGVLSSALEATVAADGGPICRERSGEGIAELAVSLDLYMTPYIPQVNLQTEICRNYDRIKSSETVLAQTTSYLALLQGRRTSGKESQESLSLCLSVRAWHVYASIHVQRSIEEYMA